MNRFFDNLDTIAMQLENMVENGESLPEEAAIKVAEFNDRIQKLEAESAKLRNEK